MYDTITRKNITQYFNNFYISLPEQGHTWKMIQEAQKQKKEQSK